MFPYIYSYTDSLNSCIQAYLFVAGDVVCGDVIPVNGHVTDPNPIYYCGQYVHYVQSSCCTLDSWSAMA